MKSVVSYYQSCVIGHKVSPSFWCGPWEKQLTTPRQPGDNPMQSSGSLFNWIKASRPDVKVGVVGKYQNNYAKPASTLGRDFKVLDANGVPLCARRVPPDIDYWNVKVGDDAAVLGSAARWDGGNQDSYHNWINHFVTDGSNIGTNTDANGQLTYYNYEKRIVSMVWSAGEVVCQLNQPHGMQVDDLFCVAGCKALGWNSPAAKYGVDAVEWKVTAVDNDTTFRFALPTNPGALTTFGFVYPKKFYTGNLMQAAALDFLGSCSDTDPLMLYLALDSCHQGQTDKVEREKKYTGSVNPNWFMMRDGVPGNYASTINPNDTRFGAAKIQWAQRQEGLKSVNDCIQALLDYADARGWGNDMTWIITSDQGVHHGERGLYIDGRTHYFVKQTALEPSCRAPLTIAGPAWAATEVSRPTHHFDLPFTLLDLFGLTDHAQHDLRDGVSLMRLLDPALYPERAIALTHVLPAVAGSVNALVDAENYKFIEAQPLANQPSQRVVQLYDLNTDPDETTNIAADNPARVAAMRARAAVLLQARGLAYRTNAG